MNNIKKINGAYHVRIHAPTGAKWLSTGCRRADEAARVLASSSLLELSDANKVARLTQKGIGQILTGKHLTCLKALSQYVESCATNRAAKTVENNKQIVTTWMESAGTSTMPPSAVEPHHIGDWINDPGLPWKRNTRASALGSLRAFFSFCAHKGWLVSDPSRLVALNYNVLSHEQKEGTAKRPFTDEQVSIIVSRLRADWALAKEYAAARELEWEGGQEAVKPELIFNDRNDILFWLVAVVVARDTGLRISDVAQLEWRSFGEAGKLVVWTQKTGSRVEHVISDELKELTGEVPVDAGDHLFPIQCAIIRDTEKRAALSVQFGRLCKRLGIHGHSFHDLRRHFAVRSMKAMSKEEWVRKMMDSFSLEEIKTMMGHSSVEITKGYIKE